MLEIWGGEKNEKQSPNVNKFIEHILDKGLKVANFFASIFKNFAKVKTF